jgi:shikimate dehydrogenase
MINYLVNPCQRPGASEVILDAVLIGLIGKGILRSKSPALHQEEADALGIRCLYQLLDLSVLGLGVEDLPRLLDSAELMGFAGLNITHPCKQAVIPLLHELSEDARAIGAVNTVRFANGRRCGFNTDAQGFAESFKRGLPDAPRNRVVQVGAGGAGAATAYALLKLGVEQLAVFDVDTRRAGALVANLERIFGAGRIRVIDDLPKSLASANGLVQATPVGTREHPGIPVPERLLRPELWVAEIVYFPLETPLLRAARALGCRTVDGGGMAVFQAAAAFEIFTGQTADHERMLSHFHTIPGD